jgi:protein ImuA
MWIGTSRKIFPPALKAFGIEPDQFIFVDLQKEKDVMWAMDEALKCDALTAVVAEMQDLSFTESRRLQLAVERSKVTGFVLRTNPKKISTTACVSRWKITPALTESIDGLPGIGFPQWKVELLRMRNGKPGTWNMRWENGKFKVIEQAQAIEANQQQETQQAG